MMRETIYSTLTSISELLQSSDQTPRDMKFEIAAYKRFSPSFASTEHINACMDTGYPHTKYFDHKLYNQSS